MKVLVIGSGAREHVLVWKIKQSSLVRKVYCAPGNAGIEEWAECVNIDSLDFKGLIDFVKSKHIDLTIVGPEAPLAAGIVDAFDKEGLKIFGPSKAAAQLEGSKVFAKEFMRRWNVPTAPFEVFDDIQKANEFLRKVEYPVVVKADGLASGKGVIICKDIGEAQKALEKIMQEKIFNEAGAKVVIEHCLKGEEVSILAISDGENYVILDSAQDHKRIFDDDMGPNTGGMGAYSPTPIVDDELLNKIDARIIEPVIRGMRKEGTPFKGVLYAGLMITTDGPMTLEFNVRFGDPEAEVVLPRLKNDLVELMFASYDGRLNDVELAWDKRSCVCVVMSSGGYPGKYETGVEIKGLDDAKGILDAVVFHAGTKKDGNKVVTAGGRVLAVMSFGKSIQSSIERVYAVVEKIKFDHCFFRRDIGAKAVHRINEKTHAAIGKR